jgi:adenosylmethionine---8-amino-7-oxononanoate aminotransferase
VNKKNIIEAYLKNIWQPFTQMKEWLEEEPIVITDGEGCILRDIDGNEYIDGYSSMWVNILGHNNPVINEALTRQISRISHSTMLGLGNDIAAEAAVMLINMTPQNLTKVFFSDNGSTAMEIALKMAFQYWRNVEPDAPVRDTFVSLKEGYHGDTVGVMSLSGVRLFHDVYKPLLFKSLHIPSPYPYRSPNGGDPDECRIECVQAAEEIISKNSKRICAVAMEPLIQCAGGFIVHPKGFLRDIAMLCKKYGILLILDEVATGFGRTGTMFACEQEGVEPDIMALSKGITGGYLPFAATLATEKIFNAFLGDHTRTLYHGHSYTGNQLGAAAAVAVMKIFRDEKVIENLQPKITLMSKLLKKFEELPHVGEVRQCGFIGIIELVNDRETKEKYPYAEKIGWRVVRPLKKKGILLRPLDNILYIMPPYCITKGQLAKIANALFEEVKQL